MEGGWREGWRGLEREMEMEGEPSSYTLSREVPKASLACMVPSPLQDLTRPGPGAGELLVWLLPFKSSAA